MPNKIPKYIEIDGFCLSPAFNPELFRQGMNYCPKDNEVVVVTYPKCGTTWMIQIVILILRDGEPPSSSEEYFAANPFLEITGNAVDEIKSEKGCIKTHLPFDKLTINPKAKYIYVARHPADCVISYYHHMKFFPIYFFSDGDFDDFFELFLGGKVGYNDYFDHLLSGYDHRSDENVLFTTFEAMKADHRGTVLKVARFLGEDHYRRLIENKEEILDKILHYSSFEYMKPSINDFFHKFYVDKASEEEQERNPVKKKLAEFINAASRAGHFSVGEFIRKGIVGEGKIMLSEDQKRKLKARIEEKTRDSDVMSLWENKSDV